MRQMARYIGWLERPRRYDWCLVAFLLLLGAALRLLWVAQDDRLTPNMTESWRVAMAFANRGEFADAYRPGSGPTAHVLPVMPMIVGTVYRLFGESRTAEVLLALLAITCGMLACWWFCRAIRLVGGARPAFIGAAAFLALLPIQFFLEASDLRVWENGIAAMLLAAYLLLALRLDARLALSTPSLLALGAASALLFFVNPATGLGAGGILLVLLIRRVPWRRWPAPILSGAVALVIISLPWALWTRDHLGKTIWSRSNLGLEVAIAFHDGALHDPDQRHAYGQRLHDIHPSGHPLSPTSGMGSGYGRMTAAGGEIAYNRQLSRETLAWIRAHPGGTLLILGRHARDFFFPPRWFWFTYFGSPGPLIWLRQALLWLCAGLGLATIAARIQVDRRYAYFAAAILLPALPYILVQPILRYRYPISLLLVCLAADGAWRLIRHLACRRGQGTDSVRTAAAATP